MQQRIPVFSVVLMLAASGCLASTCGRYYSRLVRGTVTAKLQPIFQSLGVEMAPQCTLAEDKDRYADNERHKTQEGPSRWKCEYCGKTFIGESYLDNHFDRRHADNVKTGEGAVCLADHCDVFRCDVLAGARLPEFWDVALCLEDDMTQLRTRCQSLLEMCIPSGLSRNLSLSLFAEQFEALCSFLTCDKFWESPQEEENNGLIALNVILWVFFLCGAGIYYCIFYSYFFTDTFTESIAYDPTPKTRVPFRPFPGELRQRSRAEPPP